MAMSSVSRKTLGGTACRCPTSFNHERAGKKNLTRRAPARPCDPRGPITKREMRESSRGKPIDYVERVARDTRWFTYRDNSENRLCAVTPIKKSRIKGGRTLAPSISYNRAEKES